MDVEPIERGAQGSQDAGRPRWPNMHGWWDTFFLSYLNPLVNLGMSRPLEAEDLYSLPLEDTNARLTDSFVPFWEQNKPSLPTAIFKRFWRTYFIYWVPLIFALGCNGLVAPVMLNALLTFVAHPEVPLIWGFVAAAGLIMASLISTWTAQRGRWRDRHVLVKFRSSLLGLLFRKALRLSMTARGEAGIGEVVNLISSDLDKIGSWMQETPENASNMLVYLGATALMWYYISWPGLVGSVLLLAMTPISRFLGARLQTAVRIRRRFTDARIRYVTEFLVAMKLIKMTAMEPEVEARLHAIRGDELLKLRSQATYRELSNGISNAAPLLIMVLTFVLRAMFFSFSGATIFTGVSLFNVLRTSVAAVPAQFNRTADATVSVKRLEDFLALPETPLRRPDAALAAGGEVLVSLRHVTCHYRPPPFPAALQDITITVKRGELLAVVGSVGSGKTSLLAAILGELPTVEGAVRVGASSIGYVAQEAWLFNGSMRANILFGKEFDQARYDRTLDACALRTDIAVLPGGDQVELGQRGVNLSGGQKQRVSIARAVYADPELYLFDDPLSAVDAHVGHHLFSTIADTLASRTRILVTHQTSVLPRCDRVVVMRDGRVAAIGTYAQLQQEYPELRATNAESSDATRTVSIDRLKTEEQKPADGKATLSSPEERVHGAIAWATYSEYLSRYGGVLTKLLLVMLLVFAQAASSLSDWWLAYWSANEASHALRYWLGVYLGMALSASVFSLSGGIAFAFAGIRASSVLHDALCTKILRAPISFFISTPIGQVLNRFSRDVATLDETLPPLVKNLAVSVVSFCATAAVIAFVSPLMLLGIPPVIYAVYKIEQMFRENARELSRLDSIARSPIFQSYSETLNGVETIRAYRMQENLWAQLSERVDLAVSPWWINMILSRWFSVRIEMLATSVVGAAAVSVVLQRGLVSVGTLGWLLTTTMAITSSLNSVIRWFTQFEVSINSVERIRYYMAVASEAPPPLELRPPRTWPSCGLIEVRDLWLKYRDDLGPVLRGITFTLSPGEKLGVVGRTGAGKSSLILALLRLYEPSKGTIHLDGLDISTLALQDLRSRVSVIPQDPILFASTIRENLDPFGQHSEEALWHALERVQMRAVVAALPKCLNATVAAGGGNLSVGQRQLLCMARALLRRNQVVCLDEATASIDRNTGTRLLHLCSGRVGGGTLILSTEAVIQATLRNEFASATVITIAHRLETVMEGTRVLVLDAGQVAELGPPRELLQNPSSIFRAMAVAQGIC